VERRGGLLMKYIAYIRIPVAWMETIEADSLVEAEKIAEKLVDDESWYQGLKAQINDKDVDIQREDVEVEDIDYDPEGEN
jgi:hypothetical protein